MSAATRSVLLERLNPARPARTAASFLDAAELATLRSICAEILPANSPVDPGDIASDIDRRLAAGEGDGWRYDTLPDDGTAFRRGLRLKGRPDEPADGFDVARWQEDVRAEVVGAHVAHPVSQLRMGCDGFADQLSDARDDRAPSPHAAAPMRCFREADVVDAVVVGSGAGGAPLLSRLARAGFSVVALEAGRHWNPGADFATDEQAQEKLFWRDERLSAGADPIAFGSNNSGIGVGGSTLHFTAYTPRPQADDFRLASESGAGRDWPIDLATLAPYFDALEELVGISGPARYPWGPPRDRPYPMPALPLNAAARHMQDACAALGIATSPAPNAALSSDRAGTDGRPARHACTQRGYCQAGCTTGAKGSADVVFVPDAIAHGAELRTEAFATSIERDASGRVCAVVYVQGGVEKRQRCRNVFLCGGAIETPRLLLANDGLANGSGQIGRNFMAHCGLQLWGFFDEPTHPWRGIPGGLISEATHRPADADFAGGYLLQSIGVMPRTYATQLARSRHAVVGDALAAHLARFDHVAGINILGECLPSPANVLELSDERDGRGLPKPRIRFSAGGNERRLTAHAERTLRSIWSAAGARDVWDFPRFAHVIGTCRMGTDRDDAVVDAEGRAFDVPGLHICDNSVFPSALSVNPALTIMALSLHVADRFIARHSKKESAP